VDGQGFVLLDDILAKPFYRREKITKDIIDKLNESSSRRRFELQSRLDGKTYIRALYGHSIPIQNPIEVKKPLEIPQNVSDAKAQEICDKLPEKYQEEDNKSNIEEIKLEQSDELVKRYGQQKCQLDEIVLLDLEAQCLSNKKLHPQEIIEMTAVIINVFSKEITDTFHTYVKPSVHTKLDPFCIDLTGVTQEQADNGIPLQEAMNQFEQFLEKYLMLDGNWSFITFGGWDLKTCLPSECKHKGIATKKPLTILY